MSRDRMISLILRGYKEYVIDCLIYNYGDDWTSKDVEDDVQDFKKTLTKYTDDELMELLWL